MTRTTRASRGQVPALLTSAGGLVVAVALATFMGARGHTPDLLTLLFAGALVVGLLGARASWLARGGPNLRLHDEVDRTTGVGNARAALTLIDREFSRSSNHGSVFSVTVVDMGREIFGDVHPRRCARILSDLVGGIAADVRVGDRVCRVDTSDRELIVVVLPDTGPEGARLFTDRLVAHTQRRLATEAVPLDRSLRTEVMTHPRDHEAIELLERRLQVLVGTEALIDGVRVPSRRHAHPRAVGRPPVDGMISGTVRWDDDAPMPASASRTGSRDDRGGSERR